MQATASAIATAMMNRPSQFAVGKNVAKTVPDRSATST
jgi:hypothetical protein